MLQGVQKVNPLSNATLNSPPADYDMNTLAPRHEVYHQYERALSELLDQYPDYNSLREIDSYNLQQSSVQTLQKVFTRLLEHHTNINSLTAEKTTVQAAALKNQKVRDSQATLLRQKDAEIAYWKEELHKLGKGSPRSQTSPRRDERPEGDGRSFDEEHDDFQEFGIRPTRNNSRMQKGIMSPTPMVQAVGKQGYGPVVKRQPSNLRKINSLPSLEVPESRFKYDKVDIDSYVRDSNQNVGHQVHELALIAKDLQKDLEATRKDRQHLKER